MAPLMRFRWLVGPVCLDRAFAFVFWGYIAAHTTDGMCSDIPKIVIKTQRVLSGLGPLVFLPS
jgi:hypothetical protein